MALGKLLKEQMHLQKSELLVTPKVTMFLRRNGEGLRLNLDRSGLSAETRQLVLDIMDRAFAGNEDRSGRFGSSSRGSCQRAQIWSFIGMPSGKVQDVELSNLFNDGKYRHLRWQVMLMQSGAVTHVEHPISLPRYRMKSSIDAANYDAEFIVEVKGDRHPARLMTADKGVDPKHALQIESMLLMTGMERASYIVEDKASQNWREVVYTSNRATQKQVIKELQELNEHVDNRTLPQPLPECTRKEGAYKTCPFAAGCIQRYRDGNPYWPTDRNDWES